MATFTQPKATHMIHQIADPHDYTLSEAALAVLLAVALAALPAGVSLLAATL